MVRLMNWLRATGISEEHPEWPIVRGPMHWGEDQQASSIASKGDLVVMGMVDLRLRFREKPIFDFPGASAEKVFRFRILRDGWDMPDMFVLGAPALDASPAGIGHVPQPRGHHFAGLGHGGITVPRLEAEAVRERFEASVAAIFKVTRGCRAAPPNFECGRSCGGGALDQAGASQDVSPSCTLAGSALRFDFTVDVAAAPGALTVSRPLHCPRFKGSWEWVLASAAAGRLLNARLARSQFGQGWRATCAAFTMELLGSGSGGLASVLPPPRFLSLALVSPSGF